ncbi:MAG: hypothetical protein J6S74_01960 [Alphaproteobacteria bacterium]|nr:hypothetical protein [Alphaproteobacteria bacterium]
MKKNIYVFSSLLILCGMNPVLASDCTGTDCDIKQIEYFDDAIETHYVTPMTEYGDMTPTPMDYVYPVQERMVSAKMLTIKPVPEDTRPAVWDGTHGKQTPHGYTKTVSWRDGTPIWDDSIVNYRDKNFSDWYLEPLPEIYLREADTPVATESVDIYEMYNQNMADAAATRARIDEILAPQKPQFDLWSEKYTAQDMTEIVRLTFETGDGCPFETETECEIWRRKPIVRETVSPRSPRIRDEVLAEFIGAAKCNGNIDASDPVSAPLLDRYKMLMRSANACCTDGLVYALKRAGASDGLVYKFMADDANFYGFGSRCLMMTDDELDKKYPNTTTAAVAADVRNGCLCRGRQWFTAMLAPFQQAYAASPEFAAQKFYYTYTDGLQRDITVSINNDVQNVLKQLELCP